jgi:enoyl-CoA hydratase/carnithine racemase
MTDQIVVRREGAVEIVEFSNPPMNFITHLMLRQFHRELRRIERDDGVRVLVLTGGIPDSFLTHYDVSELLQYSELGPAPGGQLGLRLVSWLGRRMQRRPRFEQWMLRRLERRPPVEQGMTYWSRCLELLDTMPKPIIAAINGLALGGACEIALCCDFRYMARGEHYRIGLPEVLVGIIPGGTGTPLRLPRVVGEARALEMLMTGQLYTPDEAHRMGLVHETFPAEKLMPATMAMAERLARGAPRALAAIRRDVRQGSRMGFPHARLLDLLVAGTALYTEDARRAMRHYIDLLSRFETLDVGEILEATSDLRAGNAVEFFGQ